MFALPLAKYTVMPGNDRFNAEAAAWDSNPDVHRASEAAKDALLQRFPKLKPDAGENGQLACITRREATGYAPALTLRM